MFANSLSTLTRAGKVLEVINQQIQYNQPNPGSYGPAPRLTGPVEPPKAPALQPAPTAPQPPVAVAPGAYPPAPRLTGPAEPPKAPALQPTPTAPQPPVAVVPSKGTNIDDATAPKSGPNIDDATAPKPSPKIDDAVPPPQPPKPQPDWKAMEAERKALLKDIKDKMAEASQIKGELGGWYLRGKNRRADEARLKVLENEYNDLIDQYNGRYEPKLFSKEVPKWS